MREELACAEGGGECTYEFEFSFLSKFVLRLGVILLRGTRWWFLPSALDARSAKRALKIVRTKALFRCAPF